MCVRKEHPSSASLVGFELLACLPAWCCCGRWCFCCCCCCFSYKNQLYFLVTVSARRGWRTRYTPKATWLLDLIAIRAKYTLAHIHMYIYAYAYAIHTHTSRCNSRISFQSFLSDTTHRTLTHTQTRITHSISPFPFPFPFHSIIIYCGSKNAGYNSKNERNEMKRQHQKAKLNCPKRSLVSAFVICLVFILDKVNELFVARSLIVFTVVAVAKCLITLFFYCL